MGSIEKSLESASEWRLAGRDEAGPSGYLARNPTILLFSGLLGLFAAALVLYTKGLLAVWQVALVNVFVLHGLYTVTHEAVHGLIHPDLRLNNAIGRISAVLEGMSFSLFKILHSQHHAYTNDPVKDPDHVIGRKPRWLLPFWTLVRLTHDNVFIVRRGLWRGHRHLLIEHLATVSLQAGVVVAAVAVGRFRELAALWLLPVVVAGAVVELSVAWLVHYPQESLHPLENSRMFRGRFAQILMLNQSLHLVHHLWPRTPWYRYGRLADEAERVVAAHRRNTSG